MKSPLNRRAASLLFHIYKPIYPFNSLVFTDHFTLALKAEQPHKDIFTYTRSLWSCCRNRFISVEGNILLCNDDREGRPGQRWGDVLTPPPPPGPQWAAARACRWPHGAVDELGHSRTVHLVTFGVTCRTGDGCVFNPISTDQLTCGRRTLQWCCDWFFSFEAGLWTKKIRRRFWFDCYRFSLQTSTWTLYFETFVCH